MKVILVALAIVGMLMITFSYSQPANTGVQGKSIEDVTRQEFTVATILEKCQGFRYPLLAILFFGVLISIYQFGLLLLERSRSKPIVDFMFARADRKGIENVLSKFGGKSELGRLLGVLYSLNLNRRVDFNTEVERAVRSRQERFGSFKSWMVFLSDTSGALGLLGTVWGMYFVFSASGGTLDPIKVVQGMGTALTTTLVGIVISLIINLLATVIGNMHDRQIETSYRKVEELRFGFQKIREAEAAMTGQGA